MKSKVIKQRNIPAYPMIQRSVRVKPTGLLCVGILFGFFLLYILPNYQYSGIIIISSCTFALLVMPDRNLIDFTIDYAIVYSIENRDECRLLYWDEILQWQYTRSPEMDELRIEMMDHSVEKIDSYSKRTMVPYMRKYAGAKEFKATKNKKAKVSA